VATIFGTEPRAGVYTTSRDATSIPVIWPETLVGRGELNLSASAITDAEPRCA
jgi:hypothetical protein